MATSSQQEVASAISLKGSTDIVAEYFGKVKTDTALLYVSPSTNVSSVVSVNEHSLSHFHVPEYAVHSIIYQRGIYPPENFERVQKYGLTLFVSTETSIKHFLDENMRQAKGKYAVVFFPCSKHRLKNVKPEMRK
jgi:hypothetical protein